MTPDELLGPGSNDSTAKQGGLEVSERPLILYAYKESDNARQNLEFFIHQGLHGAADFIFILNGETDAAEWIPDAANIRVVQRPNVCFDLGAYGEVLREGDLWRKYKRFITMNASIRGPFIPAWSKHCWSDAFLDRLSDDVKVTHPTHPHVVVLLVRGMFELTTYGGVIQLVGLTVNCGPTPHVQSMLWATDSVGMELLLYPEAAAAASGADPFGSAEDPVAFGGCYMDYWKAVHAEVGTTGLVRGAGYNVSAMMAAFEDPSYMDHCEWGEDVLYDKHYFGTNLHPYETIFAKTNRDIDPFLIDLMTKIHAHTQEGRSRDLCR
ncbi:hypothetical protein SLS62_000117 [Diatrype stigma]|uniref:Uncharacterized protein n=1 Tax=Diatrype stigma TaxID=117547 RepID=A0AAN9VAT5_9PEZI